MSTYVVITQTSQSTAYEVEATSEQEAIEMFEKHGTERFKRCWSAFDAHYPTATKLED